jgi:enterochelin esterase family protein
MTRLIHGALATAFTMAAMPLAAQATAHDVPGGVITAYQHAPGAAVRAGELRRFTLFDSTYQRNRFVWVYTPAGYSPSAGPACDLIIAFDGADYRDTIPLPLILDTLITSGRVPPFVAVLVDDSSRAVRLGDLANQQRFAEFLGRQLVPWVRRGWNVTSDPKRTIVTGSSVGGLAAANVALARPDIFGNVLAQSGAFWRGNEGSNDAPFEWLTSQVATLPRRDVRFLLDVGALETIRAVGGRGPVFIEAVRRFRDALVAKGYRVDYTEIAGAAHAPSYWRMRLPEDIVAISRYWTRDSTRASRTHP